MSLSTQSLIMKQGFDSILKSLDYHNQGINNLLLQYQQDEFSQQQILQSLQLLYDTVKINRGKIIICGIGKSFKIANKLVATLNSLSIPATILHPSEALHGDLGVIDMNRDCLIFLTSSGNTPELINLLPHLQPTLSIILLTCNKNSKLSALNKISSLIYIDLPTNLNEVEIHGLPAPTISTSLSLILADCLILALSEMLELDILTKKTMFSKVHPGGSIGESLSHLNDNIKPNGNFLKNQESSLYLSDFSSQKHQSIKSSETSLLSLNKLKAHKPISLSSSDEELDEEDLHYQVDSKINLSLSNRIKNSDSVLKITHDTFWNLNDELTLTKWLLCYDYMVLTSPNLNTGIEMSKIKKLYKRVITDDSNSQLNWSTFKLNIMLNFQEIFI